MDENNPQRQHSCLIIKRINKYQTKEKSGLNIEVWHLHFICICRPNMKSTRYRDRNLEQLSNMKTRISVVIRAGRSYIIRI